MMTDIVWGLIIGLMFPFLITSFNVAIKAQSVREKMVNFAFAAFIMLYMLAMFIVKKHFG
jgi:hypothetical protein